MTPLKQKMITLNFSDIWISLKNVFQKLEFSRSSLGQFWSEYRPIFAQNIYNKIGRYSLQNYIHNIDVIWIKHFTSIFVLFWLFFQSRKGVGGGNNRNSRQNMLNSGWGKTPYDRPPCTPPPCSPPLFWGLPAAAA